MNDSMSLIIRLLFSNNCFTYTSYKQYHHSPQMTSFSSMYSGYFERRWRANFPAMYPTPETTRRLANVNRNFDFGCPYPKNAQIWCASHWGIETGRPPVASACAIWQTASCQRWRWRQEEMSWVHECWNSKTSTLVYVTTQKTERTIVKTSTKSWSTGAK